jgi:hypothetical protein
MYFRSVSPQQSDDSVKVFDIGALITPNVMEDTDKGPVFRNSVQVSSLALHKNICNIIVTYVLRFSVTLN